MECSEIRPVLQQIIKAPPFFLEWTWPSEDCLFILPEQLTVAAQSYQLDNVSILVIPYQQKITIDVAFQTTFIFPA